MTMRSNRESMFMLGDLAGVVAIALGCAGALVSLLPRIERIALVMCVAGCVLGGVGMLIVLLSRRGTIKFPLIGVSICIAATIFCTVVKLVFFSGAVRIARF